MFWGLRMLLALPLLSLPSNKWPYLRALFFRDSITYSKWHRWCLILLGFSNFLPEVYHPQRESTQMKIPPHSYYNPWCTKARIMRPPPRLQPHPTHWLINIWREKGITYSSGSLEVSNRVRCQSVTYELDITATTGPPKWRPIFESEKLARRSL